MKQNPPQKHHYIPEFYLKRWRTGSDKRLWQFSRPHKEIVAERRHPSQVGFMRRLYSYDGADELNAHEVEEQFFKPVDSGAAEALKRMESQGNAVEWNSRLRSSWSRFIHSLLLRCPEDLELLRQAWRTTLFDDATEEWEARYQQVRQDGDPITFQDAMSALSDETLSKSRMRALMGVIDNETLGERMNMLPWHVLDIPHSRFDFLTSDRPIIRTGTLTEEGGHLALPIGPRRLFIVGKDHEAIRRILVMDRDEIVNQINNRVVSHAIRYVWGTSSRAKGLADKQMSTQRELRILEIAVRNRSAANRPILMVSR